MNIKLEINIIEYGFLITLLKYGKKFHEVKFSKDYDPIIQNIIKKLEKG